MSNELKAPIVGKEGKKEVECSANNETEPLLSADNDGPTHDTAQLSPTELKEKAGKAEEYWDRLVRQTADFENFKKRTTREKQDAIRFANESLLEKLIPALDSFDMALAAAANNQKPSIESLVTGVNMVYAQLKSALAEAGLEEIDAANRPFDSAWHQAVSQQETTELPEGQVLQQLRKGYKLRDRLLRPASVVVAKNPGG